MKTIVTKTESVKPQFYFLYFFKRILVLTFVTLIYTAFNLNGQGCVSTTIVCGAPGYNSQLPTSGGSLAPGACVSVTPATAAAEKLYSFTPSFTGSHVLQVTATQSGPNFNYYYKDAALGCGSSGWTCIANVTNATGSFPIPGTLNAGTTYYILVKRVNTTGSNNANQTFQINCPNYLTISCPADTIINSSFGQCGATFNFSASAASNCGTPVISYSHAPGSFFPVGTTTVTLTATASPCPTATCTFTVTVNDSEPPQITCPSDLTVDCNAGTDPSSTGTPTSTDNCGVSSTSYSDNANLSGCNNTGTITRTWTVTDAAGNSASCQQIITVVDNTPPSITCPADISVGNDNGSCGAIVTFSVSASDDCGAATLTYSHNSGSLFPVGSTTVIVTATDACGNAATCNFDINVTDAEDPQITCPPGVTVECGGSIDSSVTGAPTIWDNCPGSTVSYFDNTNLSGCNGTGTITRIWTVTDASGNYYMCQQVITVVDNSDPLITCPSDISVTNDPGICGAVVNFNVTATDNCAPPVISYSHLSGSVFPVGTTTVTATATDDCGNSATCEFTVTVSDVESPQITCPANMTISCDESSGSSNTGVPVATDNCSATVSFTDNFNLSGCGGTGTITRTWMATDPNGNSTSCQQIITVVDITPPIITCPSDITVNNDPGQCGANVNFMVSNSDNCGTVTMTYSHNPGSFFTAGSTVNVTATATDECGNSLSCSFNITVNDTENPSIICPFDTTIECGSGGLISKTGIAHATDNCNVPSISYSDVSNLSGCNNTGNITRTWTATDDAGNSVSCVQLITIVDNTSPELTCPEDISVGTDEGTCGANVSFAASSVDNCGSPSISYSQNPGTFFPTGTTTVTVTATDDCGNSSTCSFTVSVSDQESPQITCPPDITVECDSDFNPSATGNPTVSDNCSSVSLSYVDVVSLNGCSGTGIITRTWTADDGNGNSSSCVQIITIVDTTSPTLTAYPSNVTVSCNADVPSPDASLVNAYDNCSSVLMVTYEGDSSDGGAGCSGEPNTITRTYKVTDECGNYTEVLQMITVEPGAISFDCTGNTYVYPTYQPMACATLVMSNINGGCGPYSLSWYDDATGQIIGNDDSVSVCPTVSNNYIAVVTDDNGCWVACTTRVCVFSGCHPGTNGKGPGNNGNNNANGTYVCHNGMTLCLPPLAVAAHLAHGDAIGPCNLNYNEEFCTDDKVVLTAPPLGIDDEYEIMNFGAFPNPFSESTTIQFTLPPGSAGGATLIVYNVAGAEIQTLFKGEVIPDQPMKVEFIAPEGDGVYFAKLITADGKTSVIKIIHSR